MRIGNRLYLSFGQAAKFNGDPMIDNPRHGYNWFYYLPHMRTNKGNPFKKEVLDVSFSWLCYFWGITIYPAWVNNLENSAALHSEVTKKELTNLTPKP